MMNKTSIEYTPSIGEITDTIYAYHNGKLIAKKEIYVHNLVDIVEHGNKGFVTSNAVSKAVKEAWLTNLVDIVEHGNKGFVTSNAVAKAIQDVKT